MKTEKYLNSLSDQTLSMFLLHGVVEKSECDVRNYNRKHILKDDFHGLLKGLKNSGGHALSLDEVVEHIKNKAPFPKKSYALTFDDGFENNYSVAAPILSDFKIPAMIYVATDFVNENRMSWVDQAEHCIEETKVSSLKFSFVSEETGLETREKKIKFLDLFRKKLKNCKDIFRKRNTIIRELFDVCKVPYTDKSEGPLDQKMSWEQVKALSDDSNFTIGGHTHTHPIMTYLEEGELADEVETCLRLLEKNTGQKIKHFSYPEGMENCYDEKVIDFLKKKEIICSPTAIEGVNDVHSDLFHLKRINVA